MNTPDSTESIYVQPSNPVPDPAFPIPPGGSMPDLNLASWPNQQSASVQAMPDPGKPEPMNYTLTGDPTMGGVDPANPAPPAPNLAGIDGWPPSVSSLAPDDSMLPDQVGEVIAPQYGMPDFSELGLQPFNLVTPGVHLDIPAEFEADPLVPDLTSYNRPYGLNVHNITGDTADLWRPDPVLADLIQPDIPDGIVPVISHLDQPDPLLPDLQNPQFTPGVHMLDRPGDLDARAQGIMSLDPTVQSASSVPYNQNFMDVSGINATRRRHLDLMTNGFQSEER